LKVLATSGDTFGSYVLPGTPDGIGITHEGSKIAAFMNHEFTNQQSGFARGNGSITAGSTITKLLIDPKTQAVVSAEDAIKNVVWYDYQTGTYGTAPVAPTGAKATNDYGDVMHSTALNRFCSSSLADIGMLQYTATSTQKVHGKSKKVTSTVGFGGAVYLTSEEDGDESRGFGLNTATGQLVQLPKLGLAGTETFNVAPVNSLKTVVIGDEDGSAATSELRVYVGTKQNTGTWYEKAGLTNGVLSYVKVDGAATDTEFRAVYGKGRAVPAKFYSVDTGLNGKIQNTIATAEATGFSRIEDGAFDPQHPNDFYYVTTSSNKDAKAITLDPATPLVTARDGGGLWRLRFKDVTKPELGATVELLLDGSEPQFINMPDNLTIDTAGNILLQEDPGNNLTRSRVWAYRISDAKLVNMLQFSAKYFDKTSANFITIDEESSGILDVTKAMRSGAADKNSYFLLDAQVHATIAASRPDITNADSIKTAVEGGQVYLLTVSDWSKIYG
jgi:hypothetical protein